LPIGDDPIGGVAVADGLVIGAGGTGNRPPISPTDGFLRGIADDGSSPYLVRTGLAVTSPPVAYADRVALRQADGAVVLLAGGQVRGQVAADRRAVDSALLDASGALLRDGTDLVAAFSQGEEAWRAAAASALPGISARNSLVVTRTTTHVIGTDRATGVELWRTATTATTSLAGAITPGTPESAISAPVIAANGVVVALSTSLLVLDPGTGAVVERHDSLPPLHGEVVVSSAGVAVCTSAGNVVLVG
jgi:outer membrane protein assembly factor BamB